LAVGDGKFDDCTSFFVAAFEVVTNAFDEPKMAVVQSSSAADIIFMVLCINIVSFDTMRFVMMWNAFHHDVC